MIAAFPAWIKTYICPPLAESMKKKKICLPAIVLICLIVSSCVKDDPVQSPSATISSYEEIEIDIDCNF